MTTQKMYNRYTITAALPYANGPVHIGHLAGVYIPADIYTRYLRLRKKDVIFVCGSDEHGVPITIRAKKEGVSPQEVVDKYHQLNKKAFADLGISFDIYDRTSSPVHHKTAADFFSKLHKENLFVEKISEQYFDREAGQFLADRYIIGTCPNCHFPEAYGDQCENCGSTLSPSELINPRSTLSGDKPVLKNTKHWYLPLDDYEEWLSDWILKGHQEWKTNVYGQCKSWIDNGLQPRAVTRDLDWGVPVPLPGAEGKVLYVWFDAPIGYISATKQWAMDHQKDWEPYWKSPDTRLIHFIGKDNIVFHCIIFPAMLKAHGDYILPDNVPANEFLNLENNKISTSKNWAVWLHEYMESFPDKEDVLRYTLCANAPETKDNDFTWKDFQAKNNNELVAILGNFINRALVLTWKNFNGKVPPAGQLTDDDLAVIEKVKKIPFDLADSLEHFRFREALGNFMELARTGNKYLADTEPWKVIRDDPERVGTILNTALQIVAKLAAFGAPFLPFTSKKIYEILGIKELLWEDALEENILPAEHQINESFLLFEKIEDKVVDDQVNKLAATRNMNLQEKEKAIPGIKGEIAYDVFSQLDMRVGEIRSAETIQKSRKLLKLTVDIGVEIRTVLSGIAMQYSPEQVIGKKVILLSNLQPRNMMGIESQGMILMSEDREGNLRFLTPDGASENGSVIS
ncbi:MAG: methionine--tRNA ligase [Cyclobacteriaceae bacterium]|nr:methionine--tRNA ligase [Cyclobacteriaceae bacterium]